jgi:Dihaem cytochrome c
MKNWIIGGLIAVIGISAAGLVIGSQYDRDDDDERGEHEGYGYRYGFRRPDLMPANYAPYQQECGSCHFAYQPGLLPAASWWKIMDGLADHFGENAELDADTGKQLRDYLTANAADRVNSGRSPGIVNSLRGSAPLRITDTPYFRRQHHEIPIRMVKNNPQVGSFSRCDVCHVGANEGSYDEDSVRIPGMERWED